jgi:hypothetical protein
MYNGVYYTAVAVAVASFVTCLLQVTKKIKNPAAELFAQDSIPEFSRYVKRLSVVVLILFSAALSAGYYLSHLRHGSPEPRVIITAMGGFVTFLFLLFATIFFLEKMQRRIVLLRTEPISRLFRHLLYAGVLLGIGASLFTAVYAYIVQAQQIFSAELYLFPAYGGALLLFWLRFQVTLTARSGDYAYALMEKFEAALPLTAVLNPLWKLRLHFAALNRFLFYHLEFAVVSVVALLVAGQFEAQTMLAQPGRSPIALTVFAIGIISAAPGIYIMRVRDKISPESFLWNIRIGYIAAISIQAILTYIILVVITHVHIKYFWIVLLGSLTALLLNVYSAIYVAENHRTARGLIAAAASSVSTVIHRGVAAGMRGSAMPALIIVCMMGLAYLTGVVEERGEDRFQYGLFALSLALTSMISLFAMAQVTAVIVPLSSSVLAELRLAARKSEKPELTAKFRILRSVSVPSYVLQGKLILSVLAVIVFLVYAQILSEPGPTSLFKHLTQVAMLLIGGIASYFLAARINELVLNLGPILARETSRQFREMPSLSEGESRAHTAELWRIARSYLTRKIFPLFLGTMLLPAMACLFGGAYGLAGYLIGFGFTSFLSGNSWLTTGAAWSSARHAAEADIQVVRHTAQLEALVQADIVGDSMHEAVAPTLSNALLVTVIASMLFAPATLELHEKLREFLKTLM